MKPIAPQVSPRHRVHGWPALLLVHPYSLAVEIVLGAIPRMIIANSLGVGIAVIIVQDLIHHYGKDHSP